MKMCDLRNKMKGCGGGQGDGMLVCRRMKEHQAKEATKKKRRRRRAKDDETVAAVACNSFSLSKSTIASTAELGFTIALSSTLTLSFHDSPTQGTGSRDRELIALDGGR